uniref:C2H2-type domain-containing protein n=1 Tax=Echeneis naucrates TaxID=173247 RepID=A0A665U5V4_ECHNA
MKTPPERSGITFKVGAQLEARDRQKNWYAATIEKIDYNKERVLVHYRQWSRRHDEWFQWNSPYLRPLERVSLRRQGLNPPHSQLMFVSGAKVLACWTDCRFYPAKILRVNKDDSYTVRFYDGVVRTVKPTKVKPFQEVRNPPLPLVQQSVPPITAPFILRASFFHVWKQKSRSEKSAVGSEGWEEGESEEEDGGEREEEENKEEEVEEKVTSEENEGAVEGERKRKTESSFSHHSKKKTDDNVLLERQAHLPTTHKFSREPLYRVIKNQPPPILSIELDHNPFKCPSEGCTKSFRKASLLHYHIKYYHSDQHLDERGSQQEATASVQQVMSNADWACYRRKRSSSEGGDFISDRKSEHQNTSCHHDDRELRTLETGGTDTCGPQTLRHYFSLSDDGSDWSTLTAESGEDTSSWPVAMEMEDCEVVRCVCEVDEENDFMIQCESCLCWQHGTCMGLYEDNVPHNYICYYCRHTAGWRRAQRFLSEPDLLISGHMFGLSCVKENYSEINASKITHTNRLLAHTHGLNQVLSGLQLKISLLHSPSHPDLQLWRLPWRREEGPTLTSSPRGDPTICYISSEHCYQKPGASWEKADESEMEWEMGAVQEEQETEQKVKSPGPGLDPASVAECQLNLLDHVESLQNQISSRMDLIERELDVLESWLDHSGELEPPDPLSRLPQLKQRIRRLLRDLCTVRLLSVRR